MMNINEIFAKLKKEEKFEYRKQETVKFYCSNCKNELLESKLENENTECKCKQEYLYYDGDTINTDKKYWLKSDSAMMFGTCENCNEQIALIGITVLNKDINNDSLSEGYKDCFTVFSEDDMIKKFKEVMQYAIYLDNMQIGRVIIYKKATIDKKSIHGLLEDIERNVALVSLECLPENEDMSIFGIGVCNGHFETEDQYDLWQKSSVIAEKLINSVTELL